MDVREEVNCGSPLLARSFRAGRHRTPYPWPDLQFERDLWARGLWSIAGLDEAGRGAWAGPVVAGAVVLPHDDHDLLRHLRGVRDSKLLGARGREIFLEVIRCCARACAVGLETAEVIDTLGIVPATRRAMLSALMMLGVCLDGLLIDYLTLPDVRLPQTGVTHGDGRVLSIAAASIVAKVHRDRLMQEFDLAYPGYGFARNKGYGTAQHRGALARLGPCPLHRRSFAPVREVLAHDSG